MQEKENCLLYTSIWSVVRRFTNRGYESEDLFQIGSIGLMKAVDKFDLSYDVKFSTYAVPMITGEIRRFLRDDGMILSLIHIFLMKMMIITGYLLLIKQKKDRVIFMIIENGMI